MCVMKRTQLVTLVLCVSMVGWVIVVLTNFVSGVERKQNGKIREHIIDSYEKVTNTKRSNKSWSSSWSHGSILCCQINSWGRQVAMKYMMDLMLDLSYWGVLLHHVWLISSSGLAILLKDHWGNIFWKGGQFQNPSSMRYLYAWPHLLPFSKQ